MGPHRQKQQLQKDQIGKMVDDFINVKLLSYLTCVTMNVRCVRFSLVKFNLNMISR